MAAVIATTVSHLAHWLSVLTVFALVRTLFGTNTAVDSNLAIVASILHIISPAGVFLSAPYTEAPFSLMNIFGSLLYASGLAKYRRAELIKGNVYMVFSGIVLGGATILRSNGLLSGLPFLYDAILLAAGILRFGPDRRSIFKLSSTVIGGIMIAVGFALPQYIAYNEYCVTGPKTSRRPWCEATVPSIFSWVQEHYW